MKTSAGERSVVVFTGKVGPMKAIYDICLNSVQNKPETFYLEAKSGSEVGENHYEGVFLGI